MGLAPAQRAFVRRVSDPAIGLGIVLCFRDAGDWKGPEAKVYWMDHDLDSWHRIEDLETLHDPLLSLCRKTLEAYWYVMYDDDPRWDWWELQAKPLLKKLEGTP